MGLVSPQMKLFISTALQMAGGRKSSSHDLTELFSPNKHTSCMCLSAIHQCECGFKLSVYEVRPNAPSTHMYKSQLLRDEMLHINTYTQLKSVREKKKSVFSSLPFSEGRKTTKTFLLIQLFPSHKITPSLHELFSIPSLDGPKDLVGTWHGTSAAPPAPPTSQNRH